jgi:trigger factor
MKLLEKRTEEHQVHLRAEAEGDEVAQAMDKAYKRLVKKVKVSGFRQGKAPRDILERQIGSEALFDEAMEQYLAEACVTLVEENQIPVYARPQVKIENKEPLVFEAVIPLPPEVILGDLDAIKMKPEPVEVSEEEIDKVIERLRKQCATWETTDRAAKMFDTAVIDISSHAEGKPFINQTAANVQMIPGMSFPAPGFNEELVEMKPGDKKNFSLNLPDTYGDKTLAGKQVSFEIKLKEIKQERLPDLDDAFAKQLSPDFQNLEEVKNKIKEDLMARDKERKRMAFEDRVIDGLVEISKIEFPPLLIDLEIDKMVRQYASRLRRSVQTEEEFKSILSMTNEEKLRESYRPKAIQQIKRSLVLAKIAETEQFAASEDEIKEQIEGFAANAGAQSEEQRQRLNTEEGKEGISDWIVTRKAINYLVEKAQAE